MCTFYLFLFYILFYFFSVHVIYSVTTDELKRERDFYRARNLPCPKDAALAADKPGAGDEPEQPDNTDNHRKDEQVSTNDGLRASC